MSRSPVPHSYCQRRLVLVDLMALFSPQAYDIEQYMQCPGPIVDGLATGQCGEIIPKVINCTGANHDKRCQRVRTLVSYTLTGVDSISSAMSAPTLCGCPSKMAVLPLVLLQAARELFDSRIIIQERTFPQRDLSARVRIIVIRIFLEGC